MALRLEHRDVVVDECTIERQCEDAFIDILAQRVGRVRRHLLAGLRRRRPGLGRTVPQHARLSGLEHAVHGHSRVAGRLDGEMLRLRQLPAGRVRRHLPHHPLRQASAERPLRRLARRQMRGERKHRLRLAIDLRSRRPVGNPRSVRADRAARTTGRPAWTAARAKWSAKTSASPGSVPRREAQGIAVCFLWEICHVPQRE